MNEVSDERLKPIIKCSNFINSSYGISLKSMRYCKAKKDKMLN